MMDKETRGSIEELIDYIYENQDFLETVSWISEVDDEVISREDLALGYFLGSLINIIYDKLERDNLWKKYEEWRDKRRKRDDRKLERELGKERAKEIIEEKEMLERKAKRHFKPIKITVSEEDKEILKEILKRRIKSFREKMRREPYK